MQGCIIIREVGDICYILLTREENALIKISNYVLSIDERSFAKFLELALMEEAGLYRNCEVNLVFLFEKYLLLTMVS